MDRADGDVSPPDPAWTPEELRQFGLTVPDTPIATPNYLPSLPGYNDLETAYLDTRAPEYDHEQRQGARVLIDVSLPNAVRFAVPAPRTADDADAGAAADAGPSPSPTDGGVGPGS